MNNSNSHMPDFFKMKSSKEIWINTDFNDDSVLDVRDQMYEHLENNPGKPTIIYINSFGGFVHSCLNLIDTIKTFPMKVGTVCMGQAVSAGALLLSAGEPGFRFASPNSRIMIHDLAGGHEGTKTDLKISMKEAERQSELLRTILAKNCGVKKSVIDKIFDSNTDSWLTPLQAKNLGIIDHIGVPHISTETRYHLEVVK
jgi:ATP-dependent Clp protease, protease subunit